MRIEQAKVAEVVVAVVSTDHVDSQCHGGCIDLGHRICAGRSRLGDDCIAYLLSAVSEEQCG